jgi:peptide-methionine (S)-S-oxide reductase
LPGWEGENHRWSAKERSMAEEGKVETATLGGGCFWCLEAVFEQLEGVKSVVSGYAGGAVPNPSYEQVCTGATGHAEVVQITFDPKKISYRELLEIFFTMHDPTTPNRQGGDSGTQYRSVIFYHTPEQGNTAREVIQKLETSGIWESPIVTEVQEYQGFYPAEEYHQEYYRRNQAQPYCQAVITPKLAKLREKYLAKLKRV